MQALLILCFLVLSFKASDWPQLIHRTVLCGATINTFLQTTGLAGSYMHTISPLFYSMGKYSITGEIGVNLATMITRISEPYLTLGSGIPLFAIAVLSLPITYGITIQQGTVAGQIAKFRPSDYYHMTKPVLFSSTMLKTLGACTVLAGASQIIRPI